jgi:parallel beta-helix repeat protein
LSLRIATSPAPTALVSLSPMMRIRVLGATRSTTVECQVFLFQDVRGGTYEDNEVFGNGFNGFVVQKSAQPMLRRNRCFENRQAGIRLIAEAEGVYEDNEVFDNGTDGIIIDASSSPVFRRNRIYANQSSGIRFEGQSLGTCEDSEISGNLRAGITVENKARPTVRRNKINKNRYEGIWIKKPAGGNFFDNDLTENGLGAWDLKEVDLENVSMRDNKEL